MTPFKNSIINCQRCGRILIVRIRDYENGTIICSHFTMMKI